MISTGTNVNMSEHESEWRMDKWLAKCHDWPLISRPAYDGLCNLGHVDAYICMHTCVCVYYAMGKYFI